RTQPRARSGRVVQAVDRPGRGHERGQDRSAAGPWGESGALATGRVLPGTRPGRLQSELLFLPGRDGRRIGPGAAGPAPARAVERFAAARRRLRAATAGDA